MRVEAELSRAIKENNRGGEKRGRAVGGYCQGGTHNCMKILMNTVSGVEIYTIKLKIDEFNHCDG